MFDTEILPDSGVSVYEPIYWITYHGNLVKSIDIRIHMSYRAWESLPNAYRLIWLYDAKHIDVGRLPRQNFYSDGIMPFMTIIDAIDKTIFVDNNLNAYYFESDKKIYDIATSYTLTPILCSKNHRSRNMIVLEGMIVCETCGRTVMPDEYKEKDLK